MLKKWSGTATEGRASTGCNKQQPRHGEMVPHKTREDPDTFFFSVSSNLISYFFENQISRNGPRPVQSLIFREMKRLLTTRKVQPVRAVCQRRAFTASPPPGNDDALSFEEHLRKLKAMYAAAPVSGLFNAHALEYDAAGNTTVAFTPEARHCHTAGSLHGSGYFKLLDDTAFFAAQAKVTDGFAFTTSFTTYMVRPVPPGVQLVARGRVTSASKALVVAESTLTEAETGKLVAQGSGTFQKGPFPLTAVGAYAEG